MTETYQTPAELRARELGIRVGRWYWVRRGGDDWFPAIYDEHLGWSNQDCWDDMHHEVTQWKLIPLPRELP